MDNRKPETGAFFPRDREWHPPAFTPGYKTSVLRSPQKALISLHNTLSEITGPVFGHNIIGELDNDLIYNFAQARRERHRPAHHRSRPGARRARRGPCRTCWSSSGRPMPAAATGTRRKAIWRRSTRISAAAGAAITDEDGYYQFRTIKPGAYPWPNGVNDWRPAHIHFSIFGHGFAQRLITQMYFEGDPMIARARSSNTIADQAAIDQLIGRARHGQHAARWTRAPTSSTSSCAAAARPCSRTGWRATEMAQSLGYLKETPSQTAGPYVHIGCAPNFCGIDGVYPADLGTSMVHDKTKGERITIRGHVYRRVGHAAQGCPGRDLAGRCRRALQLAGRNARQRRSPFHRLGTLPDRHGDGRILASRRSSPAGCPFPTGA